MIRSHRKGKKTSAKDVAKSNDVISHYSRNTVIQTASTFLRLADELIEVIGDSTNSEQPSLIGYSHVPATRSDVAEFMISANYRVYRRFIQVSSLKSATFLMNAKGKDSSECQKNTMYRLRELCRSNSYKPASFKTVAAQFQRSTSALYDARKFLAFNRM